MNEISVENMQGNSLLEIKDILKNRTIISCFSSPFFRGLVQEFGTVVRKVIESNINDTKTCKHSIFGVFIEQIQNISNYCEFKKESPLYEKILNSGIVSLEKIGNNYRILTGNYIENCDIEKLKLKIDSIMTLNEEELKTLYKKQAKTAITYNTGGMGLGLIHLARNSSQPIKYSFNPEDEFGSFFILEVILKGENTYE